MIVADWGVAIILLTVVVRLILHPITKKSQLNMMRFSKQMQGLQPEIEKLKKKHKDDSQKLNQEMMKLYREKGVNPAGMAMGCFPMFLQMPHLDRAVRDALLRDRAASPARLLRRVPPDR